MLDLPDPIIGLEGTALQLAQQRRSPTRPPPSSSSSSSSSLACPGAAKLGEECVASTTMTSSSSLDFIDPAVPMSKMGVMHTPMAKKGKWKMVRPTSIDTSGNNASQRQFKSAQVI